MVNRIADFSISRALAALDANVPVRTIITSKAAAPTPPFLSIPTELRICIYEYALISDHSINIAKISNRRQPALLSVSRLIRLEAIEIYYTLNKFCFEACKSIGAKVAPFCKLQQKYRKDGKIVLNTFILCQHRKFFDKANLWKWLEAYHGDGVTVPSLPQDVVYDEGHDSKDTGYDEGHDSKDVLTGMYVFVDRMRFLQQSWEGTRGTLQNSFDCLELLEEFRDHRNTEREGARHDNSEKFSQPEQKSDSDDVDLQAA